MMIRRALSVTFVALAGILMLANAAFPHHHHGSEICYQNSHCHNESSNGNEQNPSSPHEHDGKGSHDVCVLGVPVLLPAGQEYNECKCIPYTYYHTGSPIFASTFFSYEKEKIFPFFILHDSSSGTVSFYSLLASSSLGLRAPPVV